MTPAPSSPLSASVSPSPSRISRRSLYRVCWSSVVGHAGGHGQPLPWHVAEFVAHDEALAHPLRIYWLEECRAGMEAANLADLSAELKRSLA